MAGSEKIRLPQWVGCRRCPQKHQRPLTAANLPLKQKVLGIQVEVGSRLKPAAQILRAGGSSRPTPDARSAQ